MSCLDELNEQFPVRNSAEQKKEFRRFVLKQAEKTGFVSREEDNESHINIVIGKPECANVLFTAHYDTPRRALFPNILMPTNRILHFVYFAGMILIIILIALAAGLLTRQALGESGAVQARIGFMAVYLGVYLILCFIAFRGPANKNNKNDNTSGTAAVLDLMSRLSGHQDIAFILFDDEEKGKKGSLAWTKAHPDLQANLLTFNMDCVGNGDHFVISIPPEAETDPSCAALRTSLEEIEAHVYSSDRAKMNSDQKSFRKGIGSCACFYRKGIGYYTPRIHTSRDSEASGETIDKLTGALERFVKSIQGEETSRPIDYLVLVNKDHPLPESWEEKLELITVTNSFGDTIAIEKKTGEAYLALKQRMAEEGIFIDIDSAYRSVEEQQELKERFLEKYGEEYTAKTVAEPGFSEHHTGLAVDLYFRLKDENDGFKDIVENEDLVEYPEIWEKIHERLPEFGFILRFTKRYEVLTGDNYEPWHIRYVDSLDIAGELTEKDLTLEEYLKNS